MKKVLIDGHMVNDSGIGRYTRTLVNELLNSQEVLKITLVGEWPRDAMERKMWKSSGKLEFVPYHTKVYSIKHQLLGSCLFYHLAKKHDEVIFPHFDVPIMLPKNSSVTIHDLIHFRLPKYFSKTKRLLASILIKRTIKKSDEIVTVSYSSKRDLVELFDCPPDKVKVRYNSVDPKFKCLTTDEIEKFRRTNGLGDYILCVGNRKPHKNLKTAILSFIKLKEQFSELKLIIVGRSFTVDGLNDLNMDSINSSGILFTGEVSDDELVCFYNAAKVFLFLSLYEGFGLPPLEAMACGLPVIVSNMSSLPEVVGDGGILVNPNDIEEVAKALRHILKDEGFRLGIIEKGVKRARKFQPKGNQNEVSK